VPPLLVCSRVSYRLAPCLSLSADADERGAAFDSQPPRQAIVDGYAAKNARRWYVTATTTVPAARRERAATAVVTRPRRSSQTARANGRVSHSDRRWATPVSTASGSRWVSPTPRDRFTVQTAQHEGGGLGVDVSGDGTADETFCRRRQRRERRRLVHGRTRTGDTVPVEHPAADCPSEPVDDEVELPISETETTAVTVE
jgi:hypothetical protein